MVYRWFFPIFLRNCQNLSFAWLVGCLPSIASISEIFLKLSNCYWFTARKVSKYIFFSGPDFPAFGLNTLRYSLHIQSKCGKIWTRKNSVLGHFSRSGRCSASAVTWIRDVFWTHLNCDGAFLPQQIMTKNRLLFLQKSCIIVLIMSLRIRTWCLNILHSSPNIFVLWN